LSSTSAARASVTRFLGCKGELDYGAQLDSRSICDFMGVIDLGII
jgi:hypothetical protein